MPSAAKFKSLHRQVLAPLTVMLLLTLLVGGTSFYLANSWEKTVSQITSSLTDRIILNNIRWSLRQTQQELPQDPAKARKTWENVKDQVHFLAQYQHNNSQVQSLVYFVSSDNNIASIESFLRKNPIPVQFDILLSNLEDFRQYSRSVTLATTLSMLLLGLLLMGVTARDLTRLFRELAESRDLNIRLQEDERRRIAQDLHDSVIQELVDLKRNYQPEKADRLMESIRRICHNLKPQILEDLGLAAALDFLADDLRQGGTRSVALHLDERSLEKIPKAYELSIFRVVQELFNNIKRHAQATQIDLRLIYDPSESPLLRLYLKDNGKGFEPASVKRGMGLTGVEDRLAQLDGKLVLQSHPGEGTQFQLLIPIRKN